MFTGWCSIIIRRSGFVMWLHGSMFYPWFDYQCNYILDICRYEIFTSRIQLAALDHNFHLFRENQEVRFIKAYSKRPKNWKAVKVTEVKDYAFWDGLCSTILKRRAEDPATILKPIVISPTNPVLIAATIAMREAPPTSELAQKKVSRFTTKH